MKMLRRSLVGLGLIGTLVLPSVALAGNASIGGTLGTSGGGEAGVSGGGSGTIPFTGLNLALVIGIGLALVAFGVALRGRSRSKA